MEGKRTEVNISETIGVNDSTEALLRKANEAIEIEPSIPRDAKDAIRDFLADHFSTLLEHAENLLEYAVPESIGEWWPIVVEILKSLGIG